MRRKEVLYLIATPLRSPDDRSSIVSEKSGVGLHPQDEDPPVVPPKCVSREAWVTLSFRVRRELLDRLTSVPGSLLVSQTFLIDRILCLNILRPSYIMRYPPIGFRPPLVCNWAASFHSMQ